MVSAVKVARVLLLTILPNHTAGFQMGRSLGDRSTIFARPKLRHRPPHRSTRSRIVDLVVDLLYSCTLSVCLSDCLSHLCRSFGNAKIVDLAEDGLVRSGYSMVQLYYHRS